MRNRTSFHERTSRPSTASTRSPAARPAVAAAVDCAGAATMAAGSCTPTEFSTKYKAIASRKFATGPATTISARLPSDCCVNARGRSSGEIGPALVSRSSTIFT